MTSLTCPSCGQSNPAHNGYCGHCGAVLQEQALVVGQRAPIQIGSRELATPQAKALAVTLVVGAATILAEAGLSYLQRRLAGLERPSLSLRGARGKANEKQVIVPRRTPAPGRVITIVGESIVEEKRWGRPARRIVHRFAWRGEEKDL